MPARIAPIESACVASSLQLPLRLHAHARKSGAVCTRGAPLATSVALHANVSNAFAWCAVSSAASASTRLSGACTQCISGALAAGLCQHSGVAPTVRMCSLQLATAIAIASRAPEGGVACNCCTIGNICCLACNRLECLFAWCAAGFASAVSTPHSCVPAHSASVAPSLVYASTHDTTSLHAQLPACNRHCDCISCSKERCCSHTVHHWTQSLPRMQSSRTQLHGLQLAPLPHGPYTPPNSLHAQLPGSNHHCNCFMCSKERCCLHTWCALRMQSPQKHSHGVQLALLPPSLCLSAVPAHSASVAPSLGYTSTHCTNSLHVHLPGSNRHCDCVSCSKERCCSGDCVSCSKERCCSHTPCALVNICCCLACNRLKSIRMVCSWLCYRRLYASQRCLHAVHQWRLRWAIPAHIAPTVFMCSFQVATAIAIASHSPKSSAVRKHRAPLATPVASHAIASKAFTWCAVGSAVAPRLYYASQRCLHTVHQWCLCWAIPAHTLHQ